MPGGATITASQNLSDLVLGKKYLFSLDITIKLRGAAAFYRVLLERFVKLNLLLDSINKIQLLFPNRYNP